MKIVIYLGSAILLFTGCRTDKITVNNNNNPYTVTTDGKTKILKGLLTRSIIENDTAFKWFKQNYTLGTTDAEAINAFQKNGNKFQMVIFGGTWCEDTQNLLPQFFRLADKSNYPEANITLIGVDRNKETLDNLNKAFHITNVPTFIVMRDGKEVGRVTEYGKTGHMDKELGEIVDALQ